MKRGLFVATIFILLVLAINSRLARRLLRLYWQERGGAVELGSTADLFGGNDHA